MKVLILGASGATGKLVAVQLIKKQINLKLVIRLGSHLPPEAMDNPMVEIKRGNITEFSKSEIASLLQDCDAIVSCLGHNISFKGMFGKPRNLVSRTIRSICEIVNERTDKKVKLILMSTTAYTNTKSKEKNSIGENIVFSTLMLLLPPHRDNVNSADYLLGNVRPGNNNLEWVAVRPDSLINEDNESPYKLYESKIRSPIFNAGKTSRINVSHFLMELLTRDSLWSQWRFKMPVIYNNIP